jgi:hypothetical protein
MIDWLIIQWKIDFTLWKLSSIWNKIINNIGMQLELQWIGNSIEFIFNWIEFQYIEFEFNLIQF